MPGHKDPSCPPFFPALTVKRICAPAAGGPRLRFSLPAGRGIDFYVGVGERIIAHVITGQPTDFRVAHKPVVESKRILPVVAGTAGARCVDLVANTAAESALMRASPVFWGGVTAS